MRQFRYVRELSVSISNWQTIWQEITALSVTCQISNQSCPQCYHIDTSTRFTLNQWLELLQSFRVSRHSLAVTQCFTIFIPTPYCGDGKIVIMWSFIDGVYVSGLFLYFQAQQYKQAWQNSSFHVYIVQFLLTTWRRQQWT